MKDDNRYKHSPGKSPFLIKSGKKGFISCVIFLCSVFYVPPDQSAQADPAKKFNVNLKGGYGFVDENWTTGNAFLPGADINLSYYFLKRFVIKAGYGIRFDYSQDYCWNDNDSGWICRPREEAPNTGPGNPKTNLKYNGYEVAHIPYIAGGYSLKLGDNIRLTPNAGFTSFILRQSRVPVNMNLFGLTLGADININIGKMIADTGIPLYLDGEGSITIDFIPEDTPNFLGEAEQLYNLGASIYYEFKSGEKTRLQIGGFYRMNMLALTHALRVYSLGGAYIGFSI